ncbi:sensor histidine kinase [Spartinivicinus poritis]|uniref:histidine kinase n=1 Tax=Spartinivicinus poritis TaxID=2994640 RepID=A0ABT5U9T3_9GAMM|nr:HAMP domain-containing sensor histidine kinase [Spartinivicinus sp. A2-2]MDE1461909.1 HAMP domain-containing sensor histidine kinase [Spartinivicinus sp. A2-2]
MIEEQELDDLAYGISHDIGGCLRGIISFSEMLHKRLAYKLDDKENYWFQLLQDNNNKAQLMINSLLIYSRLHQSKSQTNINLSRLIQQIFKEVKQKYQGDIYKNMEISMPTHFPVFTGIEEHWRLYYTYIIDNAFLYQPKNSPGHTPKIWVHCSEQPESKFKITVEDNGIGVSDQQLGKLIRPFMREQSEKDYPGIGMGLTLCARIVQLNKGVIELDHSSTGGLAVSCTLTM